MTTYKIGDRSLCKACGRGIEYVGPYWRHTDTNPRHPGEPIELIYEPDKTIEVTIDESDDLHAELARLRAELAAAQRDEASRWRDMILDGDALHDVRAECAKFCTNCNDFSADDAASLVMGLMDARQQAAEAGAKAMQKAVSESGWIDSEDIGSFLNDPDPAAAARAALKTLDGERKADIVEM